MRRLPAVLLSLVLGAATAGCNSDTTLVTPRVFERAQQFAFVCMDQNGETPLGAPLESCTLGEGGAQPVGFRLYALVTQSTEGSLGVVDLTGSRILDGDRRIPGFTFVDIGPLPSDVTVSRDGRLAYVTRFGDGKLSIVDTSLLLSQISGVEVEGSPVDLGGRPVAVEMDPQGDHVLASLPETGEVVVVDARALTITTRIALGGGPGSERGPAPYDRGGADWRRGCGEAPPPAPPDAGPPDEDAGPVEDAGPAEDAGPVEDAGPADDAGPAEDAGPVEDAGPAEDAGEGDAGPAPAGPEPWGLAVDPEEGLLHVADRALGIIHRIDLATMEELEPTRVDTPTSRVAVSPRLVDGTKWLYAVEARTGKLAVLDVSDGPGRLEVIEADDLLAPETRIEFASPARDISFLVRSYDRSFACDPEDSAPLLLHGVFGVAGLADGSIRLIDLDDLDRECRASRPQCSSSDQGYRYRRHRPRIGVEVSDPLEVGARPELTSGGRFESNSDCDSEDGTVVEVPCLRATARDGTLCGGLSGYVESEGVCLLDDPWLNREEHWSVTYEGALPNTGGGRGRFSDECQFGGTCVMRGEVPFCDRGVTEGMQLVLTREPPEDIVETRPECAALFDAEASPPLLPRLRIVAAFQDHLELVGAEAPFADPALLASCYEELTSYEVRLVGEWAVVGSYTGYLHPVVADPETGACVVDPARSPLLTGRARSTDDFYANPRIAFRIVDGVRDARVEQYAYGFDIGSLPAKVGVDIGSLPSDIRYSAATDELYVLDESESGLVRLALDPFRVRTTFR